MLPLIDAVQGMKLKQEVGVGRQRASQASIDVNAAWSGSLRQADMLRQSSMLPLIDAIRQLVLCLI